MNIGVIPARYASKRLPGKPIIDICGKPMIQYVYEEAKKSKLLDKVIIATDDNRIADVCLKFNADVVLTSVKHKCGTDRIIEAIKFQPCDYVINIQGDEPLIKVEIIDNVVDYISKHKVDMVTGYIKTKNADIINDPNSVKVVTDKNDNALYFSRSPLPSQHLVSTTTKIHIGIYAYKSAFLNVYGCLSETPLSIAESLEQLKVLENGYPIKVIEIITSTPLISVDTLDDLQTVTEIIKKW